MKKNKNSLRNRNRNRNRNRSRRDRNRNRSRRNKNMSRKNGVNTMLGGLVLSPSPIQQSLAESWSSKASLNQGGDFFKYHSDQHGGANPVGAPYPGTVTNSTLPSEMAGSAHLSGINKAFQEITGLSDKEGTPAIVPSQSGETTHSKGGSRRNRSRSRSRNRSRRNRNRNRSRRNRNRRTLYGGNHLGYSSIKAPTMLLPNREAYSAAALNPEYVNMKGYAEGIAASARDKITYA